MEINLEYYKIFYFVGLTGSITQAARELSLSQPAVSQSIQNLERQLGTSLFARTRKGVRFTPEGEVLYTYVSRGYSYFCQGQQKVQQMLDMSMGEIHIGASDMTLQFYLLPWLEQFHREYPGIKVTVTNAPTPETIQHLQDGKIDFGVISGPLEDQGPWQLDPLREIEDIFVAGEPFRALSKKILNYKELEELPVMCLEGNTTTRRYVEDFLGKQGVWLEPEFELATSNMLIQFAVRGLGIASVVEDFAEPYLQDGSLFRLEFQEKIPKRQICLITDPRIPGSAASEKLLKMIHN